MREFGDVIWLNGAFGAGKTTTARRIVDKIPGSRLFDPEEVGYMLRHVMVHEPVDDFQDWPLWRSLVVTNLAEVLEYAKGTLVVPMALLREQFAKEIFNGLADRGIKVSHVLLHADEAVLRQRIADSDEHPGRPEASAETRRWRVSKLDTYFDAYAWLSVSASVVDTSTATQEQVVDEVFRALPAVR